MYNKRYLHKLIENYKMISFFIFECDYSVMLIESVLYLRLRKRDKSPEVTYIQHKNVISYITLV